MTLLDYLTLNSAATAGTIFALVALIPSVWAYLASFRALSSIPTIGLSERRSWIDFWRARQRFVTDSLGLSIEGHKKYPRNSVYKLWTPDGFKVMISPDLSGEITGAPDSVLNTHEAFQDSFFGKYTGIDANVDLRIKCVRVDLTKSLERKIPEIVEEANYAIPLQIGECEEWTGFKLQPILLQIVALISGRLFIGPEKNRDPKWLNTAIQYTTDAFISAEYLRILPAFLRPLGARIIPEVRRCGQHFTVVKEIIGPLIDARTSGQAKPGDDMVQWMMDSATTLEEREIAFISHQFLVLSFASLHSTTVTLTKALYDLAARQEYIQPLREEVEATLAEEGGVFTRQSVQKMELMDSFLKESQRLSPPQTVAMLRKVMSPSGFTFSSGVHLPQGSTILGIPYAAESLDPAIYENPTEFDAYRFVKKKKESDDPNRWGFASTNLGHWGNGKHACPGRFFAALEAKLLLAEILLKYDIRMAGGKPRPKDGLFAVNIIADMEAVVEFRKKR